MVRHRKDTQPAWLRLPPADRDCPSGKMGIREKRFVGTIAATFSRELNEKGELAPTFYGYRCPLCDRFHLTRRATFHGQENFLAHVAAPEELQRWAMPSRYAPGGDSPSSAPADTEE